MQVSREKLASLGVQIGRWTHSGKFRLGIGALDILAQHAKYKVLLLLHVDLCYALLIALDAALPHAQCKKQLKQFFPLALPHAHFSELELENLRHGMPSA